MTRRPSIALTASLVTFAAGASIAVGALLSGVTSTQTVTTGTLAPASTVTSVHPSPTAGQVDLSWVPSTSPFVGAHDVRSAPTQSGPWTTLATLGPAAATHTDPTAPYNGERYYSVRATRNLWSADSTVRSAHSRPMAGGVDRIAGTGAGIALTGPWSSAGTNLAGLATSDGIRYQPSAYPAAPTTMLGVFYLDATHAWSSGTGTIAAFDGANWVTQTPGVAGNLEQIVFANTTTGWAVGVSGVIRKTTDGGATWVGQTSGTTSSLREIDCVSTTTCVSVGAGGTIRATTNGGTTWNGQTSGTTQALWDVDCVSATTCWVVGGAGVIRKTVNGGATWTNQTPVGFTTRLRGVSCVDTLRCWAVGDGGAVRTTADGGTTWTPLTSGTTQVLRSVFMVNASTGYLTGDGATVRKTTDGGTTWTALAVPTAAYQSASCISVDDCLIVSDLGTVLSTADGGATWGEQASRYVELSPLTPNLATGGSVDRVTASFVYRTTTVPSATTRFILMASPDNGANWATFDLPRPAAANTDVAATLDLSALGFTPAPRAQTIKLRFAAVPQGGALTVQLDLAHIDVN